MKVDRCPRCGAPGYLIIDRRELKTGEQVYYFILHRYKEDGKWKTRKCSIGSEGYIYVTKTHTLPVYGVSIRLSNVVEAEKLAELALRAVENIERYLKRLDEERRREKAKKLGATIARLAEHVERVQRLVSKIGTMRTKEVEQYAPA